MDYRRFKKALVSLALMCVFALPVALTATPSAYAQNKDGVYSDIAQWRGYGYRGYPGYGYRGGYPGYGYRGYYGYPGYGYRGYYGYPGYGGYYRGYSPYQRGYYGYPYGGGYYRGYHRGFRFGFRF
jgi:hypothetical protein